jgi:molybdate/tungstate transport system substrate-binding protein
MRTVFAGGKADVAVPIARTVMVIAYSSKSRFFERFEEASTTKSDWWKVLETPGLRIARSDPDSDPGGRNIIFVMMLAAKKHGQPDLVDRVLGPVMNPEQVGLANAQARELQLKKGDNVAALIKSTDVMIERL